MDHNTRLHRLFILAALVLSVLLVYTGLLFDTQVNDHDYYLSKSVRSIARKETVVASRGIITDRNGRPMVSNRSAYSLTFDTNLLRANEDENTAILRLVKLCRSQNVPWVDTLPITQDLPFTYTLDQAPDSQKKGFLAYVKSLAPAKTALREYLLEHPDAVGKDVIAAYLEEEPTSDSKDALRSYLDALEAGTQAHIKDESLLKRVSSSLLHLLDADHLTSDLLVEAGIPSPTLLVWMQKDFHLADTFSLEESRLILGVQYELSWRRLDDHSPSYVMAEDISTPFITMLSDGSYSGARIIRSYVREYETTFAAHILGTVGALTRDDLKNSQYKDYPMNAIIGKSGVESAFEPYLQGKNGTRVVSTNADGKVTGEYYSKEPQPGNTVELTIDLPFQQKVEAALANTISAINKKDHLGATGGAAVVKVGTGEVLALASYPTYDPARYRKDYNQLSKDPLNPLINRATKGRYPPGSTLKPLTSIAALEEGVITPNQKIHSPRHWNYPGSDDYGLNCWYYGDHGKINVTEAITVSCNYFFAEMGYQLGMDRIRQYMTDFGFGQPTGIEVGEDVGLLPSNPPGQDQAPWAAIGQSSMAVTPLQLANYTATLAAGGQRYEAHLLKAVKTYDNSAVVALGNTTPVKTIPIAPANLAAVKKGMNNLTHGSLAPYFKNCIVEAGAKTGTAQLGGGKKNNGVFICFAPFDDPEIAVAVAIEKGGAGAALASTAVNILNAYFSAEEIGTVITGDHQLLQ